MKNSLLRFAGMAALASGMVFAQAPAPPAQPQSPAQRWQQRRGQMFDRMAARLNLTDAQKEQARAIMQSARESARPIAQQLKQNRLALHDAIKAGKPDADIDQLAATAGSLIGQEAAIRTKAFAKVYALLTPEQRMKADQLGSHGRGMFLGGHEHGHGAGAGF